MAWGLSSGVDLGRELGVSVGIGEGGVGRRGSKRIRASGRQLRSSGRFYVARWIWVDCSFEIKLRMRHTAYNNSAGGYDGYQGQRLAERLGKIL